MAFPSWLDRSQYPFAVHSIGLTDGTISYVDEGEAEVLPFVHGTPTWSFEYRHLIKNLAKRYRCMLGSRAHYQSLLDGMAALCRVPVLIIWGMKDSASRISSSVGARCFPTPSSCRSTMRVTGRTRKNRRRY